MEQDQSKESREEKRRRWEGISPGLRFSLTLRRDGILAP